MKPHAAAAGMTTATSIAEAKAGDGDGELSPAKAETFDALLNGLFNKLAAIYGSAQVVGGDFVEEGIFISRQVTESNELLRKLRQKGATLAL